MTKDVKFVLKTFNIMRFVNKHCQKILLPNISENSLILCVNFNDFCKISNIKILIENSENLANIVKTCFF